MPEQLSPEHMSCPKKSNIIFTSHHIKPIQSHQLKSNQIYSINESIDQLNSTQLNSTHQPTNQPTNQSINQSIESNQIQSLNQFQLNQVRIIEQENTRTIDRSINQSMHQSINQSIDQSIDESINQSTKSEQ